MLIIGRRAGESIFLGDDVEIRIVDLTPSRVKLGIVAPRELPVVRSETRRAAEQNRAASSFVDGDAVQKVLNHLRGSNSESTNR